MKIKVVKFGPIENAVIDFAPMMVFTGDSNLGKSYINYLMYYVLYSITNEDEFTQFISQKRKKKDDFAVPIISIEKWLESRVEPFMRTFLNSPELECRVQIELLPSNPEKVYHVKTSITDIEHNSQSYNNRTVISRLKNISIEIDGNNHKHILPVYDEDIVDLVTTLYLAGILQKEIFGQEIASAFILPPARGAFVGENYTMKDKISSSVGMYNMFLKDYDKATQPDFRFKAKGRKAALKYNEEIERLLNGKLSSNEGKQYLELKNGQKIPLSASASSIKELSPFLFALQNSFSAERSFCIEEPEAHLHPQMQLNVTDLIAGCFSDGMMFQFTTHSDYVIQRINQLIKLNYIRNNSSEQFHTICDRYNLSERHCINPEKIKMYFFSINEDGKVKVEQLNVTEKGVPMVTFFEVVRSITNIEDDLDNAIEDIKENEQ